MYEIVNGILYNTGIDAAYSDIVNDFQSDASMGGYEINNGILYNTDIDQTYNELVSEMPADGFEMHNGILYNTSIDTAYNELMSDLVPAIQEMEKVNAENRAKGIYPPLYNGFMTDPLSDSTPPRADGSPTTRSTAADTGRCTAAAPQRGCSAKAGPLPPLRTGRPDSKFPSGASPASGALPSQMKLSSPT